MTKHIRKAAEGDEVLLTCQSEGYPVSSVLWQDGHRRTISPNTTVASTPDQLFKVTSEIRVRSSDKNNYTCNFTNDGYSATFHIPGKCLYPSRLSPKTVLKMFNWREDVSRQGVLDADYVNVKS